MGFRARLHALPRGDDPPPTPVHLALTGPVSVNTGEDIPWVLTRTLNDNPPAQFTLLFAETATGSSTPFVTSIEQMLMNADNADPNLTYLGNLLMQFGSAWDGTTTFTRTTLERTGQGDIIAGLAISNPTVGVVTTPGPINVTIIDDGATAAPPVYTTPPSIAGQPVDGQTLTHVLGVVTGVPTPLVSWVWRDGAGGGGGGPTTWGANIPLATFSSFYNGSSGTGTRFYPQVHFAEGNEVFITGHMSNTNNDTVSKRNGYVVVYNMATGASRNAQNTVVKSAGQIVSRAEMDASFIVHAGLGVDESVVKDHTGALIFAFNPPESGLITRTLPAGGTVWSPPTPLSGGVHVVRRSWWKQPDGRISCLDSSGDNFFIRTRSLAGAWSSGPTIFTKERNTWPAKGTSLSMMKQTVLGGDAATRMLLGEISNVGGAATQADEHNELRVYLLSDTGVIQHGGLNYFGNTGCTMAISDAHTPNAILVAETNTVWVVWEVINPGGGATRRPCVRTWNRTTGVRTAPIVFGTAGQSNDDHGTPVLWRDVSGHVHVVWGGHANIHPVQHAYTTNPDDPSAWTLTPPIWGNTAQDSQTYPQPIVSGNKVYVFTRDSNLVQEQRLCVTIGTSPTGGGGGDIAGSANAPSHVGIEGEELTIRETAVNASGSAVSDSAVVVVGPPAQTQAPQCTQITTMQGPNPPQVGSQASWAPFTWTGNPTPVVTRRVQANSVTIAGTNPSAYVPVTGDIGDTLRSQEVADNGVGSPVTANSAQSLAVIAAGGGSLTDVTVSADTILWNAAQGTFVCSFQAQGGPIGTAQFATDGNAGGYVQMNGTSGLQVGAVVPDFGINQGDTSLGFRYDFTRTAVINFTGANGGAFQRSFVFRPRYPKIEPTGGAGGTTVVVNSLASIRAELTNPTTAPRIIRFDTAVNTVIEINGTVPMVSIDGKENFTFVGHRRVIFGRDGIAFAINAAKNARFINCAMRPGADPHGSGNGNRSNRDCMFARSVDNISFEYCDFSWSIDELSSVIRETDPGHIFPRRFLYYRCSFNEPLTIAGHDWNEPNHPYGTLVYSESAICWYIQCVFTDARIRSPQIAQTTTGIVVQNSLIGWVGTGTTQTSNRGGVDHNCRSVSHIRGNIYRPTGISAAKKASAISLNHIGSGSFICIEPMTSIYANHFAGGTNLATDPLNAGPLDPALVLLDGGSENQAIAARSSVVPTPKFEFEGFPPMPTATGANRRAIVDLLAGEFTNVVGVRTFGGGSGDPLTDEPDPGWLAMSYVGWEIFNRINNSPAAYQPTGGYVTDPPVKANKYFGTYTAADDQVGFNPNRYNTGVPT